MDRKMNEEVDQLLHGFREDEAPGKAAAAVSALMAAPTPDEFAARLRTCRAWAFVAGCYTVPPAAGLAVLASMTGAAAAGDGSGEAMGLAAIEVRKEIAPALSRIGKALVRP